VNQRLARSFPQAAKRGVGEARGYNARDRGEPQLNQSRDRYGGDENGQRQARSHSRIGCSEHPDSGRFRLDRIFP